MPYAAQRRCQIYYDEFGDASNPTLLLVNGLGSQCINYQDDWCEMFAAEGLQVVRFDNRDVGLAAVRRRSARAVHVHAAATWPPTASPCSTRWASTSAHVMGLSMGGMIVQTMAIEHPHRLLTMTSVMSTTGEPEYRKSSPRALELLHRSRQPRRATSTSQQCRRRSARVGQPRVRRRGTLARRRRARLRPRSSTPPARARQYMAVLASGSRADGLRNVTVPTLVMHGDKDTLIDQIGGRAHRRARSRRHGSS